MTGHFQSFRPSSLNWQPLTVHFHPRPFTFDLIFSEKTNGIRSDFIEVVKTRSGISCGEFQIFYEEWFNLKYFTGRPVPSQWALLRTMKSLRLNDISRKPPTLKLMKNSKFSKMKPRRTPEELSDEEGLDNPENPAWVETEQLAVIWKRK